MLALAFAAGACSDDEATPGGRIPSNAVYDFVTLESSTKDMGAVFTMRKVDDSPLITYTSNADFSSVKTLSEGDRLILCYNRVDGETYTSGNIDVYGYVTLDNTEKEALWSAEADSADYKCPPMKVYALWRTGTYINLVADVSVYKARRPEIYVLAVDSATIDLPMPDLRVYYRNTKDNDGDNMYTVYASFDISGIWSKPDCQGVNVVYTTADGEQSSGFLKHPSTPATNRNNTINRIINH